MGIIDQRTEHWFRLEQNGRTYLLPRECPHRGGRLDLGFLDASKGIVVCPLHKSTFCLPSGECTSGPSEMGIKVDLEDPHASLREGNHE